MKDPYSVPPLLDKARSFAAQHPSARFALLRMWSAPHFYPLMIGPGNRDATSFADLTGRMYVCMFVPKDMPFSEWSIFHSARQRTEPFAALLADRVVCRRNAYLVMGTNGDDLRQLAVATCFAVERRPWRWEVDLWKSFVNVDICFLERLQQDWLD
jgi:hypothetical protein